MGFTYRKSKNIGGGTRLNVGKKSVGLSAGTKGARISVNSRGWAGVSLGIPGTNFRYRKVITTKKKGTGFLAAIINLTWWLCVASVWLCCMIFLYCWKLFKILCIYAWKGATFLFKKAAGLFRKAQEE